MILFSQVFCPSVLLKCFAFVLIAHLLHHILCAFSRCGNPGLQAGVRTRVPREIVRVGYGVLIVVMILEMDSPVSSATPNSDALSYFPVEIDDQRTFDDESSSRGAECRGARLRAMVGQDLGKLAHLTHMRYCLWCFYDLWCFWLG